jgi:hypothetical protein
MEGRRRSRLTPMSGELRATSDWATTAAEPVKERKPRRKERPAPTTRRAVIAQGLGRFAAIVAGVAGATALVALLVVWLTNSSSAHAFPRAFYFAGAFFAAVTFLGGTGTYSHWHRSRSEHELAVSRSFVYGAIAAVMIAIGVALETLL